MTTLFIDTTYDITLGLMDDAMRWMDFRRFQSAKASATLQVETHKLLNDYNVEPKKLHNLVTVAGPGFYTGLRFSEGMANVFEFFNVSHLSFYSYEVPKWCGVKSGVWMTKAYRGEYFFHHWDESGSQNVLITSLELEEYLKPLKHLFIHSDTALDEKSKTLIQKSESSIELIRTNSSVIFSHVLNNKIKEESFYFRAPEDEFKVST